MPVTPPSLAALNGMSRSWSAFYSRQAASQPGAIPTEEPVEPVAATPLREVEPVADGCRGHSPTFMVAARQKARIAADAFDRATARAAALPDISIPTDPEPVTTAPETSVTGNVVSIESFRRTDVQPLQPVDVDDEFAIDADLEAMFADAPERWHDAEPDSREIEEPVAHVEHRGPALDDDERKADEIRTSTGIKPKRTSRASARPKPSSIPKLSRLNSEPSTLTQLHVGIKAWQKIEFMKAVQADRNLPRRAKSIAVFLTDYVNAKSGDAWPSLQTLANDAGMDIQTARRGVADLVLEGYLEEDRRDGMSTRYGIFLNRIDPPAPVEPLSAVIGVTPIRRDTPTPITGDTRYFLDKPATSETRKAGGSQAALRPAAPPVTPSGRKARTGEEANALQPVKTLLPADFVPSTDDMMPAIERGVPEKKIDQSFEVWMTKRMVEGTMSADWHGDLRVWLAREYPIEEPAPFVRKVYSGAAAS